MGFMDKAKLAAERAAEMAQQGLDQGQQKIDEFQQQREAGELYRTLGEAFYAEQRSNGPRQAVVDALARLDQWHAQQAQQAQGGTPPAAPGREQGPGQGGTVQGGPGQGGADQGGSGSRHDPPGGYTLDGL